MLRSYALSRQMNMPFAGAKLAILQAGCVVTLLRDDIVDIPFPAFWDLPGGAREGNETPLDCVLRETREELGIGLAPGDMRWAKAYGNGARRTWFFVCRSRYDLSKRIRLGDEGQTWRLMHLRDYLSHPRAIPHFRFRIRQYEKSVSVVKAPRCVKRGER